MSDKAAQRTKASAINAVAVMASALTIPLMSGCGLGASKPAKAIWVTRWDYTTPDDVRQVIQDCDSLGANQILWQVRGNGTVFYPSEIEPWAEEFNFTDPGYDPLKLAIDEAHDRGIELHAWANVMPAWKGEQPPVWQQQLYHTHPEWFLYDQYGNRQALSDHYVIVNPCLPEVRAYIVSVFKEICANYDVDGLHMDYIRFVTHGSAEGIDYPHDERSLALFKQQTGKTPAEAPEAWNDFRRDAVTQLVADVHEMIRATNPGAILSAAVFPNPATVRESHFQDGGRWLKEGIVDVIYPMIYTASLEDFSARTQDWRALADGQPVVPGIGIYKHKDNLTTIEQINYAWAQGDGVCLFAYSSLFPRPANPLNADDSISDKRRRTRLDAIQPVMLELSTD